MPEKTIVYGTSPWTYTAPDYVGNAITIAVSFDEITLALKGAEASRDVDCMYRNIYIGLGTDGSVDSTPRKITIPARTSSVSKAKLSNFGFETIADVMALQITAGP